MGWEKRGMFRNVKALKLNDPGTWRRGENHTTTISSPVSRTPETVVNRRSHFSFWQKYDYPPTSRIANVYTFALLARTVPDFMRMEFCAIL